MMPVCPDCQTDKPVEDFPRNRSSHNGRGGYCKPCHNVRGRENIKRNHGSTRNYHLRARYGISVDQFDQLLAGQDGKCALCREGSEEMYVDHDHETGRIRGVLCRGCNTGLGCFRDSPALLDLAKAYLAQEVEVFPDVFTDQFTGRPRTRSGWEQKC